ncbi:MAG: transporter [Solirubrobacterales bacterium]|nr:transporter [Solirubrobacterales bacterium]
MRSSLSTPRLRRILAAYTINSLGTWFGLVALLVAVYDHTHSALAVAALTFSAEALPAFIVPAVVAWVEASTRRRELTALYIFEAIATAALAVLMSHFWLPAVLVLAALDGTAALASSALLRAELARAAREQVEAEMGATEGGAPDGSLVEEAAKEAERKAHAARNVAFSATFVLGPILGGVVVAAAGAPTALFIDVGSFLLCGALLLDLHPHVEDAGGDSVGARLRAAWRHINEVPKLRGLLAAETVALIFFETGPPIEVTYVKSTLHAGDRGLGLLLSAWGAGAVLGSVVFARFVRRPLGGMLGAGTVAIGAAYVGFATAPSLALACVAAVVGGIGNGLQVPSLISIVQRLTPQNLQGRLMGGVESLGALCRAIGLPLGGVLVAISSPRAAFTVVGLGAALTTVALIRLSPRSHTAPSADDEASVTAAESRASGVP